MIDNWGREISDFGFGIYMKLKSSINNICLVIWLIIIGFHIDLAATFALQSSNLNFISLTVYLDF